MKNYIDEHYVIKMKKTKKAAEDLLAQIDLQTDCMDGHIDRESLDQYTDALEAALDDGIGKMTFHVQELRLEVLAFALLMEQRLRDKEADKGPAGWKTAQVGALQVAAVAKVLLMESAINKGESPTKHAVDLANFAMMISDVTGALAEAVEVINGEPHH